MDEMTPFQRYLMKKHKKTEKLPWDIISIREMKILNLL